MNTIKIVWIKKNYDQSFQNYQKSQQVFKYFVHMSNKRHLWEGGLSRSIGTIITNKSHMPISKSYYNKITKKHEFLKCTRKEVSLQWIVITPATYCYDCL